MAYAYLSDGRKAVKGHASTVKSGVVFIFQQQLLKRGVKVAVLASGAGIRSAHGVGSRGSGAVLGWSWGGGGA
jgi:hypothetical protein